MAKKDYLKLSSWEQEQIKGEEICFKVIVQNMEAAKQFKVGDYVIALIKNYQCGDPSNIKWTTQLDSYGAPIKYIVVHTTEEEGLAFVRRYGSPAEDIISTQSDWKRFEIDPDYADSLILQTEYDPDGFKKLRKAAWKEVTEYNKASKIPTVDLKTMAEFFNTVQVGNTLWTSAISHFTVQAVCQLPRAEAKKRKLNCTYIPGPNITVLTLVDKKNNVKEVTARYFLHRALYKVRPRSYKELNI